MAILRSRKDRNVETEDLLAEIEARTRANREHLDPEICRQLLMLRYRAGVRLIESPPTDPLFATPDYEPLPDAGQPPEVTPEDLTPELLRAAILRHGCLLVRGLMDPRDATHFATEVDRALAARDASSDGENAEHYYEEFVPDPPFRGPVGRPWVTETGSLWAADSPPLMFEMVEAFERAGLRQLIDGYLGEPGVLSVEKCTLRRADQDSPSAWHQDGKFLGDVRALNLWLSLSRCGDKAPGLDIVPRRIDHIAPTGTPGALLDWSVAPSIAEGLAGEDGIARPIFEPGDALLFDELFLHQTAVDPEMAHSRLAIESWFFGASRFPGTYVPLTF
jgi:hypothetical protein